MHAIANKFEGSTNNIFFLISSTTTASKRIFAVLQDLLQFLVLFVRILLELCVALLQAVLPRKQKDISGEVVLVSWQAINRSQKSIKSKLDSPSLDNGHRPWHWPRTGAALCSLGQHCGVCGH